MNFIKCADTVQCSLCVRVHMRACMRVCVCVSFKNLYYSRLGVLLNYALQLETLNNKHITQSGLLTDTNIKQLVTQHQEVMKMDHG